MSTFEYWWRIGMTFACGVLLGMAIYEGDRALAAASIIIAGTGAAITWELHLRRLEGNGKRSR